MLRTYIDQANANKFIYSKQTDFSGDTKDIEMGKHTIRVDNPKTDRDTANKLYVDSQIQERLSKEIQSVKSIDDDKINTKIINLKDVINLKVSGLEKAINLRIERLGTKISTRIGALERMLANKVEETTNNRVEKLGGKINMKVEDLEKVIDSRINQASVIDLQISKINESINTLANDIVNTQKDLQGNTDMIISRIKSLESQAQLLDQLDTVNSLGGKAISDIDMDTHRIMTSSTPVSNRDLINKKYFNSHTGTRITFSYDDIKNAWTAPNNLGMGSVIRTDSIYKNSVIRLKGLVFDKSLRKETIRNISLTIGIEYLSMKSIERQELSLVTLKDANVLEIYENTQDACYIITRNDTLDIGKTEEIRKTRAWGLIVKTESIEIPDLTILLSLEKN